MANEPEPRPVVHFRRITAKTVRAIDRETALAAYEIGPERLRAALAGLSDAGLDQPQAPGEWSIRQIVHHLAEGEPVWVRCIVFAIGNPGCTVVLSGYTNNDDWATALDYAGRPVEAAVDLFAASRRYVAQLLRHLPTAWEHSLGLQALGGPEARAILGDLLDKYAEHGTAQFVIPDVLELPPISERGNVIEIAGFFGGPAALREAVNQLQALLYAA